MVLRSAGRPRAGQGALRALSDRGFCLAGALERHEPHGVWGGEIFTHGAITAGSVARPPPKHAQEDTMHR